MEFFDWPNHVVFCGIFLACSLCDSERVVVWILVGVNYRKIRKFFLVAVGRFRLVLIPLLDYLFILGRTSIMIIYLFCGSDATSNAPARHRVWICTSCLDELAQQMAENDKFKQSIRGLWGTY